MTPLDSSATVAVIGCGAMGQGIAQVAAQAGHPVLMVDAREGAAVKAAGAIGGVLAKLVDKGKLTPAERDSVAGRLIPAAGLSDLAPSALVIEAIVEDLDVKKDLFRDLEGIVGDDAILATNTSSLSITAIGSALRRPERLAGLHFFNPAPLMQLVEVVSGLATARSVADTLVATARAWGKSPVHCRSTPGFIVNRVARPYYAEALRVLQEQGGDPATIDAILRDSGGFRMGPFELMDLIGHDVNFAVTSSVWKSYFYDQRFLPSLIQQELVEAGRLGRKSGQGFYGYAPGAERPAPRTAPPGPRPTCVALEGHLGPAQGLVDAIRKAGIQVDHWPGPVPQKPYPGERIGRLVVDGCSITLTKGRTATRQASLSGRPALVLFDLALDYDTAPRIALAPADTAGETCVAKAAGLFQALGKEVSVIDDVPGMAVMRTVAMLANEAADAVMQGVASAADVDTAMTKGVNYPLGPLAWAERIGLGLVVEVIEELGRSYGEDRYRVSPLLHRKVWGGTVFHA